MTWPQHTNAHTDGSTPDALPARPKIFAHRSSATMQWVYVSLCLREWKPHTHTHIHTYKFITYIYMCVCVCVCVCGWSQHQIIIDPRTRENYHHSFNHSPLHAHIECGTQPLVIRKTNVGHENLRWCNHPHHWPHEMQWVVCGCLYIYSMFQIKSLGNHNVELEKLSILVHTTQQNWPH